MVFLSSLNHKNYWEELAAGIPEIRCPDPTCSGCLRGHGRHRRYLGGQRVKLRRLRCPDCGVTHVLLPEDVCAYQDLTFPALELAMAAESPTPAARAMGDSNVAAVRRVRRWFRSLPCALLHDLLSRAGRLGGRLQALAGEASGKLVRLRRWLWSLGLLLGGPCGLFLHGRPCWRLSLFYISW
jgi:transposase-like protein